APLDAPLALAAVDRKGAAVKTTGLRGDERVLDCFARQAEGASYPGFSALAYSADTLLPIVALHQEAHWTPNPATSTGWWGRWYLWFHIFAGWALSLLAVAGFSGLVKSE
ncbi:MAG: hypothetical protein AAF675_20750, partial [Pseudomonadota bacterium]